MEKKKKEKKDKERENEKEKNALTKEKVQKKKQTTTPTTTPRSRPESRYRLDAATRRAWIIQWKKFRNTGEKNGNQSCRAQYSINTFF